MNDDERLVRLVEELAEATMKAYADPEIVDPPEWEVLVDPNDVPVLLDRGEYLLAPPLWVYLLGRDRHVKHRGQSVSFGSTLRLRFGFGKSKRVVERERATEKGRLTVTNRRLIYTSDERTDDIAGHRIAGVHFDPSNDDLPVLSVNVSGRQKALRVQLPRNSSNDRVSVHLAAVMIAAIKWLGRAH